MESADHSSEAKGERAAGPSKSPGKPRSFRFRLRQRATNEGGLLRRRSLHPLLLPGHLLLQGQLPLFERDHSQGEKEFSAPSLRRI